LCHLTKSSGPRCREKESFTFIKTRRQASPTSVANKSINSISSWPFSSRSLRITTRQRKWNARRRGNGTEHGDHAPSGGKRNGIRERITAQDVERGGLHF